MAALDAQVLRTDAALAALEPEWWALWSRAAAVPFQSPAWLLPWWRAFAPGPLAAVAVMHQERLVALAALYIESSPHGGRLLPLGIAVSDYLDVLVDPELREAAGSALADGLSRLEDWQEWELPELRQDAMGLALDCPPGWQAAVERSSPCRTLSPLAGGSAGPAIPKGRRRKLRMAWHRARRRGEVRVIHADRANVDHLAQELIRLHSARWAARGDAGVLADSRFRAFLMDAAPRLRAAGLLRLYGLTIAGRMVAAMLGFSHRGRAYAYLSGFDPDYTYESPGALLLGHAIDEAAREGAGEMDLLRGDERYKAGWGAELRFNTRRVFRRASARVDAA